MDFIYEFRNKNNRKAIVFIHGFTGDVNSTWRDFVEFLKLIPSVDSYDIFGIGYPSSYKIDIPLWSSEPSINTICSYIEKEICTRLNKYTELHFVAHSMGGLILQKLITTDTPICNDVLEKTKTICMFGTPSNGLKKAIIGYLIKKQIQEMYSGSSFIKDLRESWNELYKENTPFKFVTVAGLDDTFVPRESSLNCYKDSYHRYTVGNHTKMIRPIPSSRQSLDIVLDLIVGDNQVDISTNPGLAISEYIYYKRLIEDYYPIIDYLTDGELVNLALAFDAMGDFIKSRSILEGRFGTTFDTDLIGTLAGRYKREWLSTQSINTAIKALEHYKKAYDIAQKKNDYSQINYSGINIAFLEMVFKDDTAKAKEIAEEILKNIHGQNYNDRWRKATEAEAYLYLGEVENALTLYGEVRTLDFNQREMVSIYSQAINVCKYQNRTDVELRLDNIFAG
ncbi:tetratricopeptide repeat-containing protein [Geovibrio ferrireducens]|uniref:tetratricopeptide repeat-containing protein n=1 Tax=Geovibrio ferrireducens TaxID=46201 RepID=UPI002246918F|nr:tetratricopeptide repeat-containing protein [Geovibrio ferrireducens]